jgi:hypothetical protein
MAAALFFARTYRVFPDRAIRVRPSFPMRTNTTHYLAELRDWLHATAEKLRAARQFHPLARVAVADDITADAIALSNSLAAAGHRSECYDLEAERILERLLAEHADLTADERRELRRAKALVHRSAEADHEITELAAVPA